MQSCRAALSAEPPQFFTVHEAIVEHCPQCPAAVASQSHKQALHSALVCFAQATKPPFGFGLVPDMPTCSSLTCQTDLYGLSASRGKVCSADPETHLLYAEPGMS
jgi:hypothetical protein